MLVSYVNMNYANAKTKAMFMEKTSGMEREGEQKKLVMSCSVLNDITIALLYFLVPVWDGDEVGSYSK